MITAMLSDVWPYLIAAGAALLGVLGVYQVGRRDGTRSAEQEAKNADIDKAERVRRTVDDWRTSDGFVRPDDDRGFRD